MNIAIRNLLAKEKHLQLNYTISYQALEQGEPLEYAKQKSLRLLAEHIAETIKPQVTSKDTHAGLCFEASLYAFDRDHLLTLLEQAFALGFHSDP